MNYEDLFWFSCGWLSYWLVRFSREYLRVWRIRRRSRSVRLP